MVSHTLVRSTSRFAKGTLLAIAAVCLCPAPALAVNKTWDGSGSPNWSDADNWTPSGVPATSGDALIWGPLSAGNRTSVNDISGLTTSLTFNASIPGNVSLSGSAITLSGNVSGAFAGTVTIGMDLLSGTSARTVGLTGAGSSLILDGVISSATSTVGLTISSHASSSVSLNGLNTFGGGATVGNGTAYINTLADSGVAQSLGPGSGVTFGFAAPANTVTGNVVYTGSTAASTNKTFRVGQNLATGTQSGGFFNNGSGDVTWTGAQLITTSTSSVVQTFTLGGSNAGNNTWAGAIRNNTGGTMALTKADAGKWILSGSNTYTGATNVNAGTLLVNGNQSAAAGAVTVASLATLGGSGTLGGAMTINGILAPGSGGIGTLSATSGVTWNASVGNDWLFELGTSGTSLAAAAASTNNDLLNVTGAFSQGSGSAFTFDFQNSGSDGWYKLVDYTTTTFTTGTNAAFQASNLPSGKTATFVVDPTTTALYVQIVPEPSTLALLGVGGMALAAGLRRRRPA